jgi:hypothetical protein
MIFLSITFLELEFFWLPNRQRGGADVGRVSECDKLALSSITNQPTSDQEMLYRFSSL